MKVLRFLLVVEICSIWNMSIYLPEVVFVSNIAILLLVSIIYLSLDAAFLLFAKLMKRLGSKGGDKLKIVAFLASALLYFALDFGSKIILSGVLGGYGLFIINSRYALLVLSIVKLDAWSAYGLWEKLEEVEI